MFIPVVTFFIYLYLILKDIILNFRLFVRKCSRRYFYCFNEHWALVGYGFWEIIDRYVPIEPFYFAAIRAAVFVGVNMKLPFTAVVLALEITYDYNVVIPIGICVIIVTYLASLNFSLKKNNIKTKG